MTSAESSAGARPNGGNGDETLFPEADVLEKVAESAKAALAAAFRLLPLGPFAELRPLVGPLCLELRRLEFSAAALGNGDSQRIAGREAFSSGGLAGFWRRGEFSVGNERASSLGESDEDAEGLDFLDDGVMHGTDGRVRTRLALVSGGPWSSCRAITLASAFFFAFLRRSAAWLRGRFALGRRILEGQAQALLVRFDGEYVRLDLVTDRNDF